MTGDKRVILRKCEGCREMKDRDLLIKITLSGSKLFINPDSKTLGRSMYVCKSDSCIKNVIKKKRIIGALKYKKFDEISRIEDELINQIK